MRENRTSGSVRGSRQAFHFRYDERSVETVYSTVNVMKYSKEFKEEALKLSDEIGVKKAAQQLGIQYYTLSKDPILPCYEKTPAERHLLRRR